MTLRGAFVHVPAAAIGFGRVYRDPLNLDQRDAGFSDRKIIERVKGLLMKLAGIDEKEAFHRLQQMAFEKNQQLMDAAQSILAVEKALGPSA